MANQLHFPNVVSKTVTLFYLLRRKNPRIDNIRGFFLVKRLGKPIFLYYDTHYPLRRKVLRIDIIRKTLLVESLAKLLRLLHNQVNLLNYDTEFYKSIPFVKLS